MSPLGCIPAQRTLKGGRHRNCAQDVNYAAKLYRILENHADYGKFGL